MAIASRVFPLKGAQATIVADVSQINLIRQAESFDTILDPFQNLTWLADSGYAKTSGFDSDGPTTLPDARAWVDGPTLCGGSDWRLPLTSPVSGLPLFNNTFSNNGTTGHGTAATGAGWGAASELGYM